MTPTTSTGYPDNLRLVRLLSDLSETKLSRSKHNLAERLGHLMGLSGSVTLARALQQLPQSPSQKSAEYSESLQARILAKRERMMRKIAASFVHERTGSLAADGTQSKVPSADASIRDQALRTFEPYRRFYVAQQLEMAVTIQNLRVEVRDSISKVSVELNQLAELDKTFEESLTVYNRKLFNVTLKILERRFKSLLLSHLKAHPEIGEPKDWLMAGAWLDLFYQDMRELLLAEFDVRLQPVLGLLEALNEHTQ